MNFFEIIAQTANLKLLEVYSVWSDVDFTDGLTNNITNTINSTLTDLWLNYNYIFKDRTTTMTCVIGQMDYDLPFDGKLKQDGLLLQPINNYTNGPTPDQVIMKYSYDTEKFYQSQVQAEPRQYTMSGEQLLLYPTPDQAYIMTCLYESNNWALSVTTVDTISNSGQQVLSVASTQEFNVGDIVYVNKGKSTEETGVIASIQSGVSLTFVGNLTFTHQLNERVTVERQQLVYQNDEPNFPSEYHYILVYATLIRLFNNDARQTIYVNAFQTAVQNMVSNSKNAISGGQRLYVADCWW